ncbi:hypothetical protein RRG08_031445 [Elysia crispata]|uniref:Uncharacterized protein n=1 Tax=Elysia crispata TaxID=231223 RepID=A0AAE1DIX5_9GAST|nr:hypothetical protein RRG08_031445 [Elysia crispata]
MGQTRVRRLKIYEGTTTWIWAHCFRPADHVYLDLVHLRDAVQQWKRTQSPHFTKPNVADKLVSLFVF